MPFESISSDATQAELSSWAMRMMAAGYPDAGRLERAMRVVKDCANIKDPLKIADRFLLAYNDFLIVAANAAHHSDPVYRKATANTRDTFATILVERFPACLKAFGTERREKLAAAKGGKRQLNVATRALDGLTTFGSSPNWQNPPAECSAAFKRECQYWTDQISLLSVYA